MSRRARKPVPVESKPEAPPDLPPAPSVASVDQADRFISQVYEPPVARLGRRLVEAALTRLDHGDPDRAVRLTEAYIALVTEDERARA